MEKLTLYSMKLGSWDKKSPHDPVNFGFCTGMSLQHPVDLRPATGMLPLDLDILAYLEKSVRESSSIKILF